MRGKVIIVTGASDGIGLATAERFASEGASVVLTDIDSARVEAEAARIVSDQEMRTKTIAQLRQSFGDVVDAAR